MVGDRRPPLQRARLSLPVRAFPPPGWGKPYVDPRAGTVVRSGSAWPRILECHDSRSRPRPPSRRSRRPRSHAARARRASPRSARPATRARALALLYRTDPDVLVLDDLALARRAKIESPRVRVRALRGDADAGADPRRRRWRASTASPTRPPTTLELLGVLRCVAAGRARVPEVGPTPAVARGGPARSARPPDLRHAPRRHEPARHRGRRRRSASPRSTRASRRSSRQLVPSGSRPAGLIVFIVNCDVIRASPGRSANVLMRKCS